MLWFCLGDLKLFDEENLNSFRISVKMTAAFR
jgi:hypothetical protein